MKKPHIAIVIALNDLKTFHGGTRNGVKSRIGYFEQFLMLYESIRENWKGNNFTYEFYLLHSLPFREDKMLILKEMEISVLKVKYDFHELKIRPLCYKIPIECDYRLVLDVDMIALTEPDFNFEYDVMAMYGGNKYNLFQWFKICKYLNAPFPFFKGSILKKGSYRNWNFQQHYEYQIGKLNGRVFPYFNNGAILIKNNISVKFFNNWERYRNKYNQFVLDAEGINIDYEGQDVVGIAINATTKNWNIFPQGFNFIVQDKFKLGRDLQLKYKGVISLIHYINLNENSIFSKLIEEYWNKVEVKYNLN